MALRKYNFVQCVEKVCTKVQKMKKLAKCKAVRVCREIRAMFVQMYRKLQEIDGKNTRKYVKNTQKCVIFNQQCTRSALFLRKNDKNNEKNEQNMCRIYIKCVESMCILYKKQCKKYSKKHAKRKIILHYCAK